MVGQSLCNPDANVGASPLVVLQRLDELRLRPGRLWEIFKEHGGTSKEDNGGVPESDQGLALRRTWSALRDLNEEPSVK